MTRHALVAAAIAATLATPVAAQRSIQAAADRADAQVSDRIMIAVLDLCVPVTDGAGFESLPAFAALGSPPVETADYDPEIRELTTDDGVHVIRYDAETCGVSYERPEDLPVRDEVSDGDALFARVDMPGSGWSRRAGEPLNWVIFDADDYRHWMGIGFPGVSIEVHRYLNPPELVRAYYEASARADARPAAETVVAAVDACGLLPDVYADNVGPPDESEAARRTDELSPEGLQVHYDTGPTARMRGDLNSYLTRDRVGCRLEVKPGLPEHQGEFEMISDGVTALLDRSGSGWTSSGANAWTRSDGARLSWSVVDAETLIWTIQLAPGT